MSRMSTSTGIAVCTALVLFISWGRAEEEAEWILHGGKVVTADRAFSIREAVAFGEGRVLAVGTDAECLRLRGPETRTLDLEGKTVLPGLIDTHTHPLGAALFEFDHEIPEMESIADVLAYVRRRAEALEDGEWIFVSQVFITRLREQRYPTREELDRAAPRNPVFFRTGPDAMLNTLALEKSGIDRAFRITDGGPGEIERDPATGEPTGMIRSATRFVKYEPPRSAKTPTREDKLARLKLLFRDYNSVGITTVADRAASAEALDLYSELEKRGALTVRIRASRRVGTEGTVEECVARIREAAADPRVKGTGFLRVIGVKTFLDGGMLTGSAYMREPWGVSEIYSIRDPEYRGHLFIPPEKLLAIVRECVRAGLQFTAHAVGDGAVHALLEAYAAADRETPVRPTRPSLTHANFMSEEAVELMARLGVVADMQPAWLYLDTRTLVRQFGYERLRWFQPLRSLFARGVVVGGGSDHMQKIGSLRSVNPYNPFLGMWIAVTRRARGYDGILHPEERLSREQAVRFYTANAAYVLRSEREVGSIEPGKSADLIVLDRDILTCPLDAMREARVLMTFVAGKKVYAVR